MGDPGAATAVIGALLLLGLLAEWAARKLPIPRVSILIILGALVGPVGFDLLPATREQWFPLVSAVALVMVGFLIGGEFTKERLRELGARSAVIALVQALGTAVVVCAGVGPALRWSGGVARGLLPPRRGRDGRHGGQPRLAP